MTHHDKTPSVITKLKEAWLNTSTAMKAGCKSGMDGCTMKQYQKMHQD